MFDLTLHLISCGVNIPPPVALLERRFLGLLTSSYLVTEYIDGGRLRDVLKDKISDHKWVNRTIKETASIIASMHNCGVVHGDLKANNLLIERPYERCCIWIVDLDGARFEREVSDKERFEDLGRLLASFDHIFSPFTQLRFLFYYSRKAGLWWKNRSDIRRAARGIYSIFRLHQKRHIKKKLRNKAK